MSSPAIDESRLRQMMQVFLAENRKLNLSAFRTEEHCWTGNILDSLAVFRAAEEIPFLNGTKRLLDLGTGGGFPLLPIALCLPAVTCIGIDAVRKKINAVQRIIDSTEIKNVKLICGRAEELGHDASLRETCEIVTARGVAAIPVLLEYAAPFLRVGGVCAFWKSMRNANELASSARAQELLGTYYFRTFTYDLGNGWGQRSILFFRKTRVLPVTYPRRTGVPKMKPLK